MKERIENAIKQLDLKQEEIDVITYGNLKKICEIAKVELLDLMRYLRYER